MAMDTMDAIAQAEAAAQVRLQEVQSDARELVAQAQRQGADAVERARRAAQEEARTVLTQGEAEGERRAQAVLDEARAQAQVLGRDARTRLDQAATRIVEGVVKG